MAKSFFYDTQNDILSVHKGFSSDEKFKGNLDVGDFVLDMSTKSRVRGIEIMNASKFLKEFDVTKRNLQSLADAEFNAAVKPNGIMLNITLLAKDAERAAKIAVPLRMNV